MRILVVGATGTIGHTVVGLLEASHEVVQASRRSTPIKLDMADPASIAAMYRPISDIRKVPWSSPP